MFQSNSNLYNDTKSKVMTHEGTTEFFHVTLVSDKEKTYFFFIFYYSSII